MIEPNIICSINLPISDARNASFRNLLSLDSRTTKNIGSDFTKRLILYPLRAELRNQFLQSTHPSPPRFP